MKLLFALAITNEDAAASEKLLDYLRALSGKSGHLVLAMMSDVHDEMKSRIRISAELAFDSVHEVAINPLADRNASKATQFNSIFRQTALHISKSFHWPFMWIDSGCTPTRPDWKSELARLYEDQPRTYLGTRMRLKSKVESSPDLFFMAYVGIYPSNASQSMLIPVDSPTPLNIASAAQVMDRMTATKAIQQAMIATEGDLLSVRDDAVVVTGDRQGLLRAIKAWDQPNRYALQEEIQESEPVKIKVATPDPLVSRLANGIKTNGARV
jgi:hypothetical protein